VAAFADDAEDGRLEQGEDPARVAVEPATAAGLDDVPSNVRSVEDDAERLGRKRLPPLAEVALAASALAELRHGHRNTGVETLKRLLRRG